MAKFAKGNPGRPVGSRNTVNRVLDQLAIDGAAGRSHPQLAGRSWRS
jgi:hypothetical protein